jgi:hypothetical protein
VTNLQRRIKADTALSGNSCQPAADHYPNHWLSLPGTMNATRRFSAPTPAGGYGLKEIGDPFGLHYSWVSRILKKQHETKDKT